MSDKVQFSARYQRLLYSKGYENALGWWRILEKEGKRVKLQPFYEGKRKHKSIGYLTVDLSPEILNL